MFHINTLRAMAISATALVFSFPTAISVQAQSPATQQAMAYEAAPLSLDECISIALNTNPTIKIGDLEIKKVDYSKKETLAALLPNVSFGATYNRTLAKQVAYMNMDRFGSMGGESGQDPDKTRAAKGKGDTGIKMGLDNSWSTGFQASMPLIAPQLWQSMKLSDSQILIAVETSRNSKLELINSVKTAYYALILAQDSREVIQESYDMASLTYDTYVKQFSAGAASEYDVLRASVAMKNIEPELIQADIAIKQASLQLHLLMGIDAKMPISAASTLEQIQGSATRRMPPSEADILANNPSLRLNVAEMQVAERNVSIQRASLYPTLAASINYNWTSASDGNPLRNFRWTPYSMAGLTLSIPIFEGGSRYSKIKQAKLQHQQAILQRENLERSINNQINLALDNINLNAKQIESCVESEGQAVTAHDIMQRSFDIGAASYLDLRDSQLALTRARLARLQAVYNYLVADAGLELLLGAAPIEKLSKLK